MATASATVTAASSRTAVEPNVTAIEELKTRSAATCFTPARKNGSTGPASSGRPTAFRCFAPSPSTVRAVDQSADPYPLSSQRPDGLTVLGTRRRASAGVSGVRFGVAPAPPARGDDNAEAAAKSP